MSKNKIFIFEHISGGGFNRENIPSSLFCEGFGMLRSIVTDFKAIDFEIFTLIDYRIVFLSGYLEADFIKQVNAEDNYIKEFKKLVKRCEYCFIIAPEFSNILYDLTKIASKSGRKILSVDLTGIQIGASKIKTHEFFKKKKVNTPQTYQVPFKDNSLDFRFILQKFKELKSPIVIKPNDGVGGESIFYFESDRQIKDFFQGSIYDLDFNRNYILQEFIEGDDLSISLIGFSGNKKSTPLILSVNSQDINIKNKTGEYLGGHTPVESHEQIINNLTKITNNLDFSKFTGYFGIDFVKGANQLITFIEINPRLTTSYIGIRNVICRNPVELILYSKINFVDFSAIEFKFHSIFKRLELCYTGNESNKVLDEELIPNLTKRIPEFVTPPISFNIIKENRNYSCFISTKTKSLQASKRRVKEIKKCLEQFEFKIIK